MRFEHPLVRGTLLRREKRFLAHVRLDDGREVVAHTGNTGAMTGCAIPGSPVWLSPADRPHRKLPWTWELVAVPSGAAGADASTPRVLAGINTLLPNRLVEEAVAAGRVPELAGYDSIRREVRSGERRRLDLLLEGAGRPRCWVEVKNVTLVRDGVAAFPDARTERGRGHLLELLRLREGGDRAVLFWVLQRGDADAVRPAEEIDPSYAETLRTVAARGVEVLARRAAVSPEEVVLAEPVQVRLR